MKGQTMSFFDNECPFLSPIHGNKRGKKDPERQGMLQGYYLGFIRQLNSETPKDGIQNKQRLRNEPEICAEKKAPNSTKSKIVWCDKNTGKKIQKHIYIRIYL